MPKYLSLFTGFILVVFSSRAALAETLVFSDGLKVETQWQVGPRLSTEGESQLLLQFSDHQNQVEPEGDVKVQLWMEMGGHGHPGAPTKTAPVAGSTGLYVVSKIYFNMDGAWEIRIVRTLPNGQKETQAFDLEVN